MEDLCKGELIIEGWYSVFWDFGEDSFKNIRKGK